MQYAWIGYWSELGIARESCDGSVGSPDPKDPMDHVKDRQDRGPPPILRIQSWRVGLYSKAVRPG